MTSETYVNSIIALLRPRRYCLSDICPPRMSKRRRREARILGSVSFSLRGSKPAIDSISAKACSLRILSWHDCNDATELAVSDFATLSCRPQIISPNLSLLPCRMASSAKPTPMLKSPVPCCEQS